MPSAYVVVRHCTQYVQHVGLYEVATVVSALTRNEHCSACCSIRAPFTLRFLLLGASGNLVAKSLAAMCIAQRKQH